MLPQLELEGQWLCLADLLMKMELVKLPESNHSFCLFNECAFIMLLERNLRIYVLLDFLKKITTK